MSNVFQFPARQQPRSSGIIHIWAVEDGQFSIGHESGSGNSWGSFELFPNAASAINGAIQLNRETYGGDCEVFIGKEVLAALPPTTAKHQKGDF